MSKSVDIMSVFQGETLNPIIFFLSLSESSHRQFFNMLAYISFLLTVYDTSLSDNMVAEICAAIPSYKRLYSLYYFIIFYMENMEKYALWMLCGEVMPCRTELD